MPLLFFIKCEEKICHNRDHTYAYGDEAEIVNKIAISLIAKEVKTDTHALPKDAYTKNRLA
jgi:hypothetical protein